MACAQLIRDFWICNIQFIPHWHETEIRVLCDPMDHEEKERLARKGDVSKEAVSLRLRAARESLLPRRSQKSMAEEFGVPISTYASWENADVFPSVEVIRHFRREYEFTFDFIIYGDWLRLPADVQERVFDAMRALEAKADRGPTSPAASRG
jgi:transcriptional regulator with XRE-family HTH domain